MPFHKPEAFTQFIPLTLGEERTQLQRTMGNKLDKLPLLAYYLPFGKFIHSFMQASLI